jgi:hypothetical protein
MGGVPGFRVRPEDEMPGFRVTLQDVVPGFNLDANGVPSPESNWSAGMRLGSTPRDALFQQPPASQMVLASAPQSGTILQPNPSVWPDWLNRLLTMPLPTVSSAFDLWTGRRIVPYEPLINRTSFNPTEKQAVPDEEDVDAGVDEIALPSDAEPVETETTEEAPPTNMPVNINAPTGAAPTPTITLPPTASQTIWPPWFPQPSGREPYPQADTRQFQRPWPPARAAQATSLPPPQWAKAAAGSNLVPPVAGSAWQGRSLPRSQPTQQNMTPISPEARMTPWPPAAPTVQTSGVTMGDLEPRRELEFAQPSQKAISAEPRTQQAQNGSSSPSNGAPSLGQSLLQSSVDTLVPGAHYQQLARQQFDAGNYVHAAGYQAAALADALLGAATLGMSTRLAAAGRTAVAEGGTLLRRAFNSRDQLLRYLRPAPKGMHWHHIVEEFHTPQFGQQAIHGTENVVAIPIEEHRRLTAYYQSKPDFAYPNKVREWLREKSFEEQHEFGMAQLKRVLGY